MLQGWATITIEWALALLSLIFALLRIYVRFTAPTTIHNFCDTAVICAWLALVCIVACDSALFRLHPLERGSTYDLNLLELNKPPQDSLRMLKIIYASVLPYTLILYLVKATIVAWYYAITPRTLPRCRIVLHTISGACFISFCLAIGFNGFSCYPVQRNWSLDPASLCIASARPWAFFVSFACHLSTNVLIFVYPFPLLKSKRGVHQRRKRWGIIFLFALGFLAIAATCARVIAISISATSSVVAVWTTTECTANILVACCPPLHILIQSKKAASQMHSNKDPSLKSHLGSADTYLTGNNNQERVMPSGIWDGTESTAPDWIRLESRQKDTGVTEGDLERGSVYPPGLRGERDGISAPGDRHRITPPSLVLHPGRGIIKHAPGVTPQREGTPCWMNIPEIPFLCETKEDDIMKDSSSSTTTATTAKQMSVRWDVTEDCPPSSCGIGQGGKTPLLKRQGMD